MSGREAEELSFPTPSKKAVDTYNKLVRCGSFPPWMTLLNPARSHSLEVVRSKIRDRKERRAFDKLRHMVYESHNEADLLMDAS